jgi:UV DNA damage endonuclease
MVLRFGLCCIFNREPVLCRYTAAKAVSSLSRSRQLAKLLEICLAKAENLLDAVQGVSKMGIGAFLVLSPISPRYTHPEVGYELDSLPRAAAIREALAQVNEYRSWRAEDKEVVTCQPPK